MYKISTVLSNFKFHCCKWRKWAHCDLHFLYCSPNRFSQEIQNGKQFSQTVEWLELVKATEEAQTKMSK